MSSFADWSSRLRVSTQHVSKLVCNRPETKGDGAKVKGCANVDAQYSPCYMRLQYVSVILPVCLTRDLFEPHIWHLT